ncbi:hypothetical protein ACWGIV_25930 [Streptomyces sp. NPDC054844]
MSTNSQTAGIDFSQVTPEEWDSARRMSEAVTLHVLACRAQRDQRTVPPFIAIDLADGSCPDGVLYDSRRDAVRHQKSDYRFFVKIGPAPMGEREALVCLMYARRAHAAGHIFAEEEPIVPQRLELAAPFIPRALRGLKGVMRHG